MVLEEGVRRLLEFTSQRGIRVKVMEFGGSVRSVEEASRLSRVPPSSIVKTILVVADGRPAAVLLPGDRRIDYRKLARALGASRVRLAKPDEVERLTGFKPGEVTPLSDAIASLTVVADKSLASVESDVVVGGGSLRHLARVLARDLLAALNPIVADVSRS